MFNLKVAPVTYLGIFDMKEFYFNPEKTLKIIADIFLICGAIATLICLFTIVFVDKYGDFGEGFSFTGFIISIGVLFSSVTFWAFLRVICNISNNRAPAIKKDEIRKQIILGDKQKAREMIIDLFFEKMSGTKWKEESIHKVSEELRGQNIHENRNKFNEYKNELIKNLEKIGESTPDEIMKINSINGFREIY